MVNPQARRRQQPGLEGDRVTQTAKHQNQCTPAGRRLNSVLTGLDQFGWAFAVQNEPINDTGTGRAKRD